MRPSTTLAHFNLQVLLLLLSFPVVTAAASDDEKEEDLVSVFLEALAGGSFGAAACFVGLLGLAGAAAPGNMRKGW